MDVYVQLQNIQIWEIHVNAGYEHTVFIQRVNDRNGIQFEEEEKKRGKLINLKEEADECGRRNENNTKLR